MASSTSAVVARGQHQNIQRTASSRSQFLCRGNNCDVLPHPADDFFLRFCFAMAFAAVVIGILTFLGIMKPMSATSCNNSDDNEETYSMSSVIQDFRALLSFGVGAVMCWKMKQQQEDACPPTEPQQVGNGGNSTLAALQKVQLYVYML
eukprot:TRINITY_DN11908_c0_g2_i1.p1 TRINITY_DN11908_c0_g2~~TRINITY_DN11908_c0_g2_i1.p1  ORF type:complete len:149 (-),score=27.61 TRINITY_DN11908_c0_g2_i1:393-839(-)